jgi:glutamate N-acetyltransferase/amino-acid N-acetyltransferase
MTDAPPVSPLAPAAFSPMPEVRGVRLATIGAHIRYRDRDDLLLAVFAPGTAVAGVFTQSQTAAAPVLWCRSALKGGQARALIVNAGNANCFTGRAGEQAVERTVIAVATQFDCPATQVFVASTGIIGTPLPVQKVCDAIPHLADRLDDQKDQSWRRAALAIATTDTFPKGASATATIDGIPVVINGIAKGAGMIAPHMATMLAFVFTDAAIAPAALQALLSAAVEPTFNAITIDGDTSTNDTLLLFATAAAPHRLVTSDEDPRLAGFRQALHTVLLDLAQQVVRDGEGATKFVTIRVSSAADASAARRIAFSIANSPLVKTAIAGADANWGRIVMAVGKAGERINADRLSVAIGGVVVARGGAAVPDLDEAPVSRHMRGNEVEIAVDVGVGDGEATVWTCDLTHGYIDINAAYRS